MHARVVGDDIDRMRAYEARLMERLEQLCARGMERVSPALRRATVDLTTLRQRWMEVILGGGDVSMAYLHNLVDRIEVEGREVRLHARQTDLTELSGDSSEKRWGAAEC